MITTFVLPDGEEVQHGTLDAQPRQGELVRVETAGYVYEVDKVIHLAVTRRGQIEVHLREVG